MDGVIPRDSSPSSPARPPSPSHSLTGEVALLSIAEVPPPPHLANNCAVAAQCGLRPAASLNNVADLAGDDLARSWPQLSERDGTRSLPVTSAPVPPVVTVSAPDAVPALVAVYAMIFHGSDETVPA